MTKFLLDSRRSVWWWAPPDADMCAAHRVWREYRSRDRANGKRFRTVTRQMYRGPNRRIDWAMNWPVGAGLPVRIEIGRRRRIACISLLFLARLFATFLFSRRKFLPRLVRPFGLVADRVRVLQRVIAWWITGVYDQPGNITNVIWCPLAEVRDTVLVLPGKDVGCRNRRSRAGSNQHR